MNDWKQGNLFVDCIYDFGYKLCCIDWYSNVHASLKYTVPDYSSTMKILTDNMGLILCPDCVIERLTEGKEITLP